MAATHTTLGANASSSSARKRSRQRTKREKASSAVYNLTLDIHDLRHQIQQLALQRALILSRPRALAASPVSPDGSSCLKIERLFGVFNRGYQVLDGVPRAYIEMLTGGASLYEAWRQHTDMFASRRCDIQTIRVEPMALTNEEDGEEEAKAIDDDTVEYIVHVETVSHGAFTISSIQAAWPAVLHDPQLTQTLLDREMAKPVKFRFAFNRAGRVVWFAFDPDFHTALTLALGGDAARAQRIMQGEVDVASTPRFHEVADLEDDITSVESSDIESGIRTPCAEDEREEVDLEDDIGDGEATDMPAKPSAEPRHSIAFLLS